MVRATATLEGILETALYASDLDAADRFYGDVLGLERIARLDDRHLFFRCGQGVLLIFNPTETLKPAADAALPVPTHGTTGPGHACFRVSADNLALLRDRLAAAGVMIESEITWPNGSRSFYFRDPAGNSLECAEPGLWPID
ncbi:catechol 2,3-dioxygenase-like lactoylglutathione lyase family enzyme [Rhizobium sp. PP-F2F-G48]|uniref:VOC family protein n=1 Tax=Rhizobium sp. PP-F2F-G48 TaxID=2135651 RepID=UPI00104D883C|nr:VOC family protein [Rhizobium sp. PP-F2F-G48]TCM56312.1 catechol 2,3-dioxygenase-like lactoylglutathione lyase family enzyme [Rhizobium sp. PP-F2F-G48]